MRKLIIRLVRGSQRGFTLIELLAVMAVIGVLAAIVTTSVSGTSETSTVAQAKADASTIENATGTFFTAQAAAEVIATRTVTVTALIASTVSVTGSIVTPTFDTAAATIQEKSNKWPEVFLTENSDTIHATTKACVDSIYCDELPTAGLHTDAVVIKLIVTDSKGAAIGRSAFLTTYTALDFAKLTAKGFAAAVPSTSLQTAEVNVGSKTVKAHNFLWLLRKSTSSNASSGANDARGVAVFKLASVKVLDVVSANDTVTLSYAQIY